MGKKRNIRIWINDVMLAAGEESGDFLATSLQDALNLSSTQSFLCLRFSSIFPSARLSHDRMHNRAKMPVIAPAVPRSPNRPATLADNAPAAPISPNKPMVSVPKL